MRGLSWSLSVKVLTWLSGAGGGATKVAAIGRASCWLVALWPAPFCTTIRRSGLKSAVPRESAKVKLSTSASIAASSAAAVRLTCRSAPFTPFWVASMVPITTPPKVTFAPETPISPAPVPTFRIPSCCAASEELDSSSRTKPPAKLVPIPSLKSTEASMRRGAAISAASSCGASAKFVSPRCSPKRASVSAAGALPARMSRYAPAGSLWPPAPSRRTIARPRSVLAMAPAAAVEP